MLPGACLWGLPRLAPLARLAGTGLPAASSREVEVPILNNAK